MTLIQIHPCDYDEVWPLVEPMLEPALTGAFTTDEVKQRLDKGQCQLWMYQKKFAIITKLTPTAMVITIAGGEGVLEAMRSQLPLLEWFARHNGKAEVIVNGRSGWIRAMRPLGYEQSAVLLRRTL